MKDPFLLKTNTDSPNTLLLLANDHYHVWIEWTFKY